MKNLLKAFKGPLVFVLAVALVGLPNAPVASQLPGTGGVACADGNMCYGGHGNDETGCTKDMGGSAPADGFCESMESVAVTGAALSLLGVGLMFVPGAQLGASFVLLYGGVTTVLAMSMLFWQDCARR